MHLAVVACGDRLEETVTMLKSALLFSIKPLKFHIFAEDQLHNDFSTIVSNLLEPSLTLAVFHFLLVSS